MITDGHCKVTGERVNGDLRVLCSCNEFVICIVYCMLLSTTENCTRWSRVLFDGCKCNLHCD